MTNTTISTAPVNSLLKLAEIISTAGTQIRARIDTQTVDQYANDMQDATNKFPPVVVFHDGSQYILADGFHRVMAATRNGFKDILADVRKGTKTDALKFALSANAQHGLPRTNTDKRRSVMLALEQWPNLSDREIARICAVDHTFVGRERRELVLDTSCPPLKRIGRDGKARKSPTKSVKQPPAPKPDKPNPAGSESKQLRQLKKDYLSAGPEDRISFLKWLQAQAEIKR